MVRLRTLTAGVIMLVKNIVEEDFVNYKMPSMFIATCFCDWKCCIEQNINIDICQNAEIIKQPNIFVDNFEIYHRYISNPITKAIVIGGLEPIKQFDDIYNLIKLFRNNGCNDNFVIYTGYYPNEIQDQLELLKPLKNIVFKFGRYIPNQEKHYDEILGISLVSNNQYGEVIC